VLEVLDSGGMPSLPGQEGTVVVTNLFNRTMPLIRYSLGDRSALLNSAPAKCNCGPGVKTILSPAGRADDIVVLPDRKRISPRVIDDLVYIACAAEGMESRFCRSIRDYQIVQDTSTLIRVLFLADGAPPDKLVATFTKEIKSLHPDLQCTLVSVPNLDLEESGKRRRVTSHVE
jgi:phenylacetate-CoA ligase